MFQMLKNFVADESGATAIEYALIGIIIAVGIVDSFMAASTALGSYLQDTADAFPD